MCLFQCYYDGKFHTSIGNVTSYVGGEVQTLENNLQAFFINLAAELGVSLYGQRIWYKLPFESFSELKFMCNGEHNFQNMCAAAVWTKMMDIFMKNDDVDDVNGFTSACLTF